MTIVRSLRVTPFFSDDGRDKDAVRAGGLTL